MGTPANNFTYRDVAGTTSGGGRMQDLPPERAFGPTAVHDRIHLLKI